MSDQPAERATWIGPGGEHLEDREGAVAVEIQEVDAQGVPLGRTYAELTGAPTITLSDDPADALIVDPMVADGMAKQTWDLHTTGAEPVTTLAQLLDALGVAGAAQPEQRQAVARMLILPSWAAAPPALRDEAHKWLEDTRPSS